MERAVITLYIILLLCLFYFEKKKKRNWAAVDAASAVEKVGTAIMKANVMTMH